MATNNLTLTRQPTGAFVRGSEGAGTTTLTDRDSRWQIFNLSAARTVVLPGDGAAGDVWQISNNGSGILTLQSSNGNTITTLGIGGAVAVAALVNAPTTSANWSSQTVAYGVMPGFMARKTSDQVLPTGGSNESNITFTEVEDIGGVFDGTTFTVPTGGAGRYLISAAVYIGAGSNCYVSFKVTASSVTKHYMIGFVGGGAAASPSGSIIMTLAAGDTVTVAADVAGVNSTAYGSTGMNAVMTAGGYDGFFSAAKIL